MKCLVRNRVHKGKCKPIRSHISHHLDWVLVWGGLVLSLSILMGYHQLMFMTASTSSTTPFEINQKPVDWVPLESSIEAATAGVGPPALSDEGTLSGPQRFARIIHTSAHRYDLEPAIIKAIILAESNFNPRAVSQKGALGLMQLMPNTARSLGVQQPFDPHQNIDAGTRFFKRMLIRHQGDLRLALAAYNAGARNVKRYKGVPPFKATQAYIQKVLKYHRHYQQSEA